MVVDFHAATTPSSALPIEDENLEAELRARTRAIFLWFSPLFGAVVLAWSGFDYLLARQHLWLFLWLRLASVVCASVTSLVVLIPRWRHRSFEAFAAWILPVVAGIAVMLTRVQENHVYYVQAFGVVVLAVGLIPSWPPRWTLRLLAGTLVVLIVAFTAHPPRALPSDVVASAFFLATIYAFSAMVGIFKFHMVKTDHRRRRQVEQLGLRLQKAREFEVLNQQLGQALEAARESARLKSEFVANVSHELRTPLNAIINIPAGLLEHFSRRRVADCGRCSAAFELEDGEDVKAGAPCPACASPGALRVQERCELQGDATTMVQHLAHIERSARHLLGVINDILDFSKLEAEQMRISPEKLLVSQLLEDVVLTLRPVADAAGIRLVAARNTPGLQLHADPGRTMQVLINLVGNAIKFSTRGGVVAVRAVAMGDMVRLSVADRGMGIAKEHLEVIFEPFRQVDGRSTRRHGGTGLGLSISRRMVELQGGRIWVESELGMGSTFYVELPVNNATATPSPLPQPVPAG